MLWIIKKLRIIIPLFFLFIVCPLHTAAQENFRLEYDFTYLDKFIWRGIPWIDDPVLWTTVNTSWKGFRAHTYFNTDMTDFHDSRYEFTEFEYTVGYTFHINTISINPGYMQYSSLNNLFETERKIVFDIKKNTLLNPHLNMKFDLAGVKGSWGFLKISHSFPLGIKDRTVDTSALISLNSAKYYGVDKGLVFSFVSFRASLPFALTEYLFCAPAVEFHALVDPDIRDVYETKENTVFTISLYGSLN